MDMEKFEDGSSIEWFSRESLLYRDGEYTVQVEYDYSKIGIFKLGRKILCSSIQQWETYPNDAPSDIPKNIKQKIIGKAVKYFENHNLHVDLE